MPRCRDGSWCIDDLCHMTSETLCGIDVWEELDENGEIRSDADDEFEEDFG